LLEINIIDDVNESRKPLHCYTKNESNKHPDIVQREIGD
jgi:uncharacterized Zn-finger protein